LTHGHFTSLREWWDQVGPGRLERISPKAVALMPVEAYEFDTGVRYYWKCPSCSEISLPFRDAERAAEESSRHLGCSAKRR